MDSTPICYDIKNINNTMPDMYSVIAELYAECVHSSAYVSRSVDTCWFVQHNLVWYSLFSSFKVQSKAKKIIMYKVRRIIYEHILEFEKYPNFKAARYLGFCLNVLWISEHSRRTKDAGWPLSKVVMRWVENNYLTLYENYRDVAEACLLGGISFDVDKKAIVKTYRPSMSGKPNQAYLYLK